VLQLSVFCARIGSEADQAADMMSTLISHLMHHAHPRDINRRLYDYAVTVVSSISDEAKCLRADFGLVDLVPLGTAGYWTDTY